MKPGEKEIFINDHSSMIVNTKINKSNLAPKQDLSKPERSIRLMQEKGIGGQRPYQPSIGAGPKAAEKKELPSTAASSAAPLFKSKFCTECGVPFAAEHHKFCAECGS